MGSGKTTVGKLLAARLDYAFFDMDKCIEAKKRKTVSQIFTEEGEDAFRLLEKNCLHELADFESVVISTGGGVPCFFDNMDYMNERGMTVYLNRSVKELAARLEADKFNKRPLVALRKGTELEDFIDNTLTAREPKYLQANLIVSGTEEEVVEQIMMLVKC